MSLSAGTRLGPYEIVATLGAGGMGEVYRSRDTRLGREVAIKVLPAEVASDPERLRRFEQEARAASALNHPHILTVHDVGADAGTSYLVTELLEGESLRERLRRGPVAPKRAGELAMQIAHGLAAAHERGIVHRDLKPENLFLTRDGVVKVLDFGLARITPEPTSASQLAQAPTVEALTGEGTVLGTVGYMSPEQVRGERAGPAADIFALGCVLYEMLTGERAFARQTSAETLTAILRDEPSDLASVSGRLPPSLRRIVKRALAKEPAERFPSAHELAVQLAEAVEFQTTIRRRHNRRTVAVAVAAASALVALVTLWIVRRPSPSAGADALSAKIASIAVLPLENLSGASELDYLRLALGDGMTTLLSHTPSLAVRPFSRSRALTDEQSDPAAAGRALQAAAVLTGHFFTEGADLRLALELFAVEENRVLWRQDLTTARNDLLDLDREIGRRLENDMLPALGFAPVHRVAAVVPSHPEAYELFLRGVSQPYADPRGLELIERSVALDASYAPAWSALGFRLYQKAHYGGGGAAELERAGIAWQRALALDPASIDAVTGLVYTWTESGELTTAYDSAAALVARRGDSATALAALAYTLRYGGLHDQAARVCEEGLARDPHDWRLGHCAWIFLELGDFRGVEQFVRTRSDSEWHRYVEIQVALRRGDRDQARAAAARLENPGDWGIDFLVAYLDGAAAAEVRRLFEAQRTSGVLGAIPDGDIDFTLGTFAAYAGLPDVALAQLRRGLDRRFCAVELIRRDPLLAPLRTRPEFEEIRRQADACLERFVAHLRAVGSPHAAP